MSANEYQKHILVLPEDDANRQIARGNGLDHMILSVKPFLFNLTMSH